jgi:nitroreductase
MHVLEAIHHRRAVRDYTDEPVERPAVEALLDAAVWAPSAVNQQPWAFAVVQDPHFLKRCSDRAKRHWASTMAGTPSWERVRPMIEDPGYCIFYNASTLIIICAREGGLNPEEDCCLAAENLMLAACAMGLGTCPIGFARPWLNLPQAKRELGIPEDCSPVFPVILGYPRAIPPAPERRAPEIVAWK